MAKPSQDRPKVPKGEDDEGESNLAIHPQDERQLEEAFEDIERKYETGAVHELLGYTVRVPVTISADLRLGLDLRDPNDPRKIVGLDDTKPEQRPWPSTEVARVDPLGQIGRWNEYQLQQAEVDDWEDVIYSDQVVEPVAGPIGRAVWLQAVEVENGPMVHQHIGSKGIKLIQQVRQRIGPGYEKARLVLCFFIQASYCYRYKARLIRGNALHVGAVALGGSDEIFGSLVEWGIDLLSECEFMHHSKRGQCLALHLAAGRGRLPMLSMLLEAGVDVNIKTRYNQKDNYTALHEAAFFKQTAVVKLLLESHAKVNEVNLKQQTPLHIASAVGGYNLCRLMVKYDADVEMQDSGKRTALDAAMESGRYPPHKLFHLTGRSFSDLLKVAYHSPAAASDLLRNVEVDAIHPAWGENLAKEMIHSPADGLSKWICLLGLAPKAGEEVIEALTVAPPVKDASHHPLPRRVSLPEGSHFLCQYQPEDTWQYFGTDAKLFPDWHSQLCPGCDARFYAKRGQPTERWLRRLFAFTTGQSTDASNQVQVCTPNQEEERGNFGVVGKAQVTDLVPVKVVTIKLPGIICSKVLYVLSSVGDRHIFVKIGVRAIVTYVWNNLVRYQYYNKTFQRMLVIVLLFCFVCQWIPADPESLVRRGAWSLVASQVYHELFYEVFEAVGYIFELKLPKVYFRQLKNVCDYASAALGLWLMHLTQHDFHLESLPVLLAVVIMGRWVMLIWTCRAFVWAGEKILPVLQASCVPMGGIMLVTLFIFAGFWHCFAALTLAQGALNQYKVLLGTLRLLVLGDGDGAGIILGLYDGDEELGSPITFALFSVAVIGFCIVILNLFIAVHGEAYDKAQETANISFLQEKAAICLHCLLMPKWPPPGWCKIPWPRCVCMAIYVFSFVAWLVLISFRELHPWLASFVLLAGSLLGDAVLLQLPWSKQDSQNYYFWICYRDDYEEADSCPVAESDLPGRLSSVKQNNLAYHARISENLGSLKNKVEIRNQSLELHLGNVDLRLRGMEARLATANQALSSLVPPVLE
ncbi:unnamed protein product [Effrenium voratum]|uniref:Ion transport domain-containing protein n=1 Tax=Effrenium voratum TaxID=2562239 RepID=A0AA36MKA9_9DINO|nr:unnamed protein product [Effrenium voratum]CAJ1424339.1 unnamed protein product [Effrenium voratum]